MSNRAYLSLWSKDFSEAVMLDRFGKLLETVPLSATWPGFDMLTVRGVSPDEAPLVERDLRAAPVSAEEVIELARECPHADCSYEVEARWDLWTYDAEKDEWVLGPQRLEILCLGDEYDDEAWREVGHFWIHAGFEHLFTGHAGLLGAAPSEFAPADPAESEFLERMRRPASLSDYRQKTQDNIRKLMGWVERIDRALPLDRWQLWSEGEANFEARMESILAGR
ncbi:MAG: hypothetical protein KGL59_10720 [Acidobacteriota bacterium]|nr:hypothetical protein [Acidobacteriota bacterium]